MTVIVKNEENIYFFEGVSKVKVFKEKESGIINKINKIGLQFFDKTRAYEEIKCYNYSVYGKDSYGY